MHKCKCKYKSCLDRQLIWLFNLRASLSVIQHKHAHMGLSWRENIRSVFTWIVFDNRLWKHSLTGSEMVLSRGSAVPVWSLFEVLSFPIRCLQLPEGVCFPISVCVDLYFQDSSGMRLWKRKWFVLADYCLFYYKGGLLYQTYNRITFTHGHLLYLLTFLTDN